MLTERVHTISMEGEAINEVTPLLRSGKGRRGLLRTEVMGGAILSVVVVFVFVIGLIFIQGGKNPPPIRDKEVLLSFFVVGDWGFGSSRHQPECAKFMGDLSDTLKPDFVISTGDNVYPNGLKGKDDPKFKQRFTEMYSAKGLQVPWYSVLGNHDYGDGSHPGDGYVECRADSIEACANPTCCPSPIWQRTEHMNSVDRRWHCTNSTHKQTLLNGALDITYIDTTPYITRHLTKDWASNPGGLLSQNTTAQTAQIRSLLSSSSKGPAKWRLVVGHHAVRSYGGHCQNLTDPVNNDCLTMSWLSPILQEHKVQLYLNGHDHDLQHIKFPNETTHFVTSGGGGDFRPGEFDKIKGRRPHAQYLEDGMGFAVVDVYEDVLQVTFYAVKKGNQPAHVLQVWDSQSRKRRNLRGSERRAEARF